MKIKKLEYYDKEEEWKLEPVEFLSDLNLLVGISGAGKTSILRAIRQLKVIANGASLNGVGWDISFVTDDNTEYRWSGEFETQKSQIFTIIGDDEKELNQKKRFRIISENIYVNNDEILDRSEDKIIFYNQQTPKLSAVTSIVELLSQEEKILPIRDAFKKIISSQSENFNNHFIAPLPLLSKYENLSLEKLKESNISIEGKLFFTYQKYPEMFQKIKKSFASIFTKVEDLKLDSIESVEFIDIPSSMAALMKDAVSIQIKEKGVDHWIFNISSGMLKSLMYIAELYLSPQGSVILIDEFENSLGVNCLNSITDDILLSKHDRQYIITSHHPYIINDISPEYWKIVTRKGGTITVHNAEDFHISQSRQKAFIDLINVLEEFPEGLDNEFLLLSGG